MIANIFIFVAPQVPFGLGIGLSSKILNKITLFIFYVWVNYPYKILVETNQSGGQTVKEKQLKMPKMR
jgi:hypothetical protein